MVELQPNHLIPFITYLSLLSSCNFTSNSMFLCFLCFIWRMDVRTVTGVDILQNTMARGGDGAGEKMKTEAVRNKMKKKGKGEGKRRKGKGGELFFC